MRRTLLVGGVVAVVAALCSTSALAARGHGKYGPFATFAHLGGPGGGAFGLRGFGGPMFGPVFAGPRMHGHRGGLGMRGGGPGGGLLAGSVLKTAATYLGISVAELQADLKGGKTLAQEAGAKGKTAAGLITALTNDAKENLASAVAAGWLTQAQANAVLDRVTAAITSLVNDGPSVPPLKHAGPLSAAATYLGLTAAELRTALEGGKNLAQIAADKGKSVDGLVAVLTADAKVQLDKAVAASTITQAQANAILGKLTQRVTDMVNGVRHAKGTKAAPATTTALKVALRFGSRR